MSIVVGNELSVHYGGQDVFAEVELSIARGDKIALVGPNGAGKTTLLRVILGLEEPSEGYVHRARGLRMGYLPQEPEFPSQQTLHGEMLDLFEPLREQERALVSLADEIACAEDPSALMQRYARAEQRFELAGGYTYETRIRRVLSGLGFGPDTYEWPISLLSGGQVTRALLARLLLQEPELLILDEPTNHLDLAALEWTEGYLQGWPHSLLLVSHDRYFLDRVVSRVWELNHGVLECYRGNYTRYVAQRRARRTRRLREYQEQQEFIAKTEEFIRRYKAGQRSKEARGRETRLKRLERIQPPPTDRQMRLQLSSTLRAGDNVLTSNGALIGHQTRPEAARNGGKGSQRLEIFDTGSFLVQRGQRVALLGPNASGKTTLLRTILGEIEPLSGRIRIGASVRIGYLPQAQDWLDPSKTALEQLLEVSDLRVGQARDLLARFLFTGDEVFKEIRNLSGGERSRLALAILAVRGANFLLLDEPTTHLDIESQETLQKVLADFDGTTVFVSHDRYLIDALATHVWHIHEDQMRQFEGNYSGYLEETRRQQEALAPASEAPKPARSHGQAGRGKRQTGRPSRHRGARARLLEAEIAPIERKLAEVTERIGQASAEQDLLRLQSLSREYQGLEAALAELMEEWGRLTGLGDDGDD